MTATSSKGARLALRVAVIGLAIIGTVLLGMGWLWPQQIAVRYSTGKHLFWELQMVKVKAQIWEVLFLYLKEENKSSELTVTSGGYGWSFAKHQADCSVYLTVHPLDEKAPAPDEALVKRMTERIDRTWKPYSMASELERKGNGYEIRFSFTLTDDDYLQALNKEAGKGD